MPIDQPEVSEAPPAAGSSGPPDDGSPGGISPPSRPRRRRVLIGAVIAVVVCLVVTAIGGWAYAAVDLPPIPSTPAMTRIQYSDGATFATFGLENRLPVASGDVPEHLKQALLAVEDPDFDESGGNPITATGRALRRLVTGGAGRETLTERYVRAIWKTSEPRTTILADKLDDTMSKDEILLGYLYMIYFGRGTSGVATAAQAYFGKDVSRLSLEESAVLVSVIDDPTRLDPSVHPDAARDRWNEVLDAMVDAGYLGTEARRTVTYPAVLRATKPRSQTWRYGSTGVLGARVEQELKQLGISDQLIRTGGLTVTTTISAATQKAATQAVKTRTGPELASALVSIDPRSGAVRAYYGGQRGYGNLDLASTKAAHPAAATIEPFVLATGVSAGYGIDSRWNGTSGQVFEDLRDPLHNTGRSSACGPRCSLADATVGSVGTVFWALTSTVGAGKVAATAAKAGLRTLDGAPPDTKKADGTVALGRPRVSVLDQASAYATLASNGVHREPYFITKVRDADGSVLWDRESNPTQPTQAWDSTVGRDVSAVLQQAYAAEPAVRLDRPAAIKSGGQRYEDSSDAWLTGYTPQLATAVWTGTGDSTGIPAAERNNGLIDVRGAGVPGAIWRDYMVAAHTGLPAENFEKPARVGAKKGNAE